MHFRSIGFLPLLMTIMMGTLFVLKFHRESKRTEFAMQLQKLVDESNYDASITWKIRRENYFRDNGNGTLTWGFELENGYFHEFTVPGSFPDGEVRVVWKDHGYTPMKSPSTLLPETTFTWHWDNFAVYGE